MLQFIIRRVLLLVPMMVAVSIISFLIIQLPPGDFLTSYISQLESQGQQVNEDQVASLKIAYGLGQPIHRQYIGWMQGMLHGQFGMSLYYMRPVGELVWERLGLTFALAVGSLAVIWMIAFPIGIYSAVRQYSLGDYLGTLLSFVGLGIPSFLLALVVMWLALTKLGMNVTGLFSPEMQEAPWSIARFKDLLQHIWVPVLILSVTGTAGLLRIMRANLLDELHKPYVVTARAKGMPEGRLILKYPVRAALNPFVSTVGWTLPAMVSGSMLISVVLNLPTTGPLLLRALQGQDMYLAGTIMLLVSVLTVVGTLISDILLAWLDPRIRIE